MKKKSIITVVVLVILVAVAAFVYYRKGNNGSIQWRTEKIMKGNISVSVTASGSLEPNDTVKVGTQVSGTIAKLYADYNSRVRRGELLAVLDTTNLVASLDNAKAGLQSAEAKLNLAKQNYNRTKVLYKVNQVAKATYDQDLANYKTAISNLAIAKAQVKTAKINLGYAKIYAPISGVVLTRNVSVGQTVAASFNTPTIFTIANNLTQMQVQASVDEADIGEVKKGQKVNFTVDAYPNETFHGIVREIRLKPTITSGVVNYTVMIEVKNPNLKLLPGMTANISIMVNKADNVDKIPAMALQFQVPPSYVKAYFSKKHSDHKGSKGGQFHRRSGNSNHGGFGSGGSEMGANKTLYPGDKTTIWIKKGNVVEPRRVTIGISNGTYTQVSGNIKPGENVVIGAITPQESNNLNRSPFGRRR